MASDFINVLNSLLGYAGGEAENTTTAPCVETITHYDFYQFALIPSVLITLFFSVTKRRRNILLGVLNGRPGLIHPMDTLTRSSRISYACAFGATAFLVYQIVLEQTYAINYNNSNRAVKSFVAIASMFMYGMVFYPLFASLVIGSLYGYTMGALYIWMLTGVEIYRTFQCDTTNGEARVVLFFRGLPSMLCLIYLSLSMPVRAVLAWKRGHFFGWREDYEQRDTLQDVRASYAGHHVQKLFQKPKVKLPAETRKGRIHGILLTLVHRFIYQRKRGFRYPARFVSVLFTAVLVVYTLTFEILALVPRTAAAFQDAIVIYIEEVIGTEPDPNEDPAITNQRQGLWVMWWAIDVVNISIIVSTVTAAVFSFFNVLHTMSSYRANLMALYKGDHSRIPPASNFSNTSHCINYIKYAGFQVGYIVWSYVIQVGILGLLSLICAVFISLIRYDFTNWVIWLLEYIWPILLTVVMVMVVNFLMAKLVFLQERGRYLALDNRSVFFNFTFFMFFYNIFLGLASCLLRILKAMLVGIVFLSRLDSSTLPRRFEFFDPGFKAYMGFMHMEVAHSHPVLVVFCRLMLLGLQNKRERESEKMKASTQPLSPFESDRLELVMKNNRVHAGPYVNGGYDNTADNTIPVSDPNEEKRRRSVAARFNWHVIYTLLHNPEIRVTRKGYIQLLRRARQMGVYIPVSDRQADVNFEQLEGLVQDANEKLHPTSRRKKVESKDADLNEEQLKEVVTAVENGHVKKVRKVMSPAGVLAAHLNRLTVSTPLEDSASPAASAAEAAQGVQENDLPSTAVEIVSENPVKHESPDASKEEKVHDDEGEKTVAEEDRPPVPESSSNPQGDQLGQGTEPQGEGNDVTASHL